uniref:Kazal-like domain-containing protein n=1 Tax=Cyanistes caeruleus TaxID=156563 RepID=A0A8C0UYD2_CYACU
IQDCDVFLSLACSCFCFLFFPSPWLYSKDLFCSLLHSGDEAPDGYSSAESICGSDGKTYENICQFNKGYAAKRNISMKHKGPCESGNVYRSAYKLKKRADFYLQICY